MNEKNKILELVRLAEKKKRLYLHDWSKDYKVMVKK